MARRNPARLEFDAISLEGGLLPAEWLNRVAAVQAPAQSTADYGIPRGLQLRDEIGRYWRISEALWADFHAARGQRGHDADGVARAFVRGLLTQVFGFGDLAPADRREAGGRVFPLAFEALEGRVPVVVGPAAERLDDNVPRHGDGGRRRTAFGALQEYLNADGEALWGIVSNGLVLRLARDNASLTRPAWVQADLERIFTEGRFADFSLLWLILHASRFGRPGQPSAECPLERWRTASREEGSRARADLRRGVTEALLALGQGFLAHSENQALRRALAEGTLTPEAYFNQLLRLVYRMIFLLTVEEREILHPGGAGAEAKALYREGYGMRRLRERSVRRAQHDRNTDLWASLAPVFAALGHPRGEPALALPGLGGLFAPEQCPWLDGAVLENRALLGAVFHLAWLREERALPRVNWKDMGPEELGSVYESLLELVPRIGADGRGFDFAGRDESAGNARKLSGSYYTPDALVQQLLDTALEPVVAQRLAAHPDRQEQALLSISVIDPACGSGHFLLAAARRLAGHLARVRTGGTPGGDEYRHALRDVVTHCIHGVDRNPMALELARMALWLEAYTPDRALGFLDSHLVGGDALLGLMGLSVLEEGIPDAAFKALTGDDREVAKALAKRNRDGRKALDKAKAQYGLDFSDPALGRRFAEMDAMPDDDVDAVRAKRERWDALRAEVRRGRRALAADCFLAAFLAPKTEATRDLVPTTGTVLGVMDGSVPEGHSLAAAARRVCADSGVLHWHLAFPQVFERGGFDVVLGNPPWERIKLQEQEFFAARAPEVAQARNKAARDQAIAELATAPEGSPERNVHEQFVAAKHMTEAASVFCHTEARYPLTGVGDVNTYALFAETMYRLNSVEGRAGVILPIGIAMDDTTKRFFGHLVQSARLGMLLGCHEIRRWFPGTDDRNPFCLLTIGAAAQAELAFQMKTPADFSDSRRWFRLSPDEFALINPNTRTCPIFRSERDAELTKKIYRHVPVLIDENQLAPEGNPWGLSFMRMFDMANDSASFLNAPDEDALPLYEAKMVHQFDHRWATYDSTAGDEDSARDVSFGEKADPEFAVHPRYWISSDAVVRRTARVPDAVFLAIDREDEDIARQVLAQWFAGYYLNRGNDERGNSLLLRSISTAGSPSKAMGNWLAVKSLEHKFPLTPADEALFQDSDSSLETAQALVAAKTPGWLMGWRDICRATDERTVIASAFPIAAVGDTLLLMLPLVSDTRLLAGLLADQCSLVHDFIARQKVGGTHLKYHTKKQITTLPPSAYGETQLAFILPRVLELTYTACDLSDWARDLGYEGPPFGWDPERRALLRAELDAYYAHLYGLTRDELRYVLDPADVMGPDYPSETFRVLKQNEQKQYGEYRTRRLVLEAWDRLFPGR